MIRIFLFTFSILLFIQYSGNAQDEGPITRKARVTSKATTIYVNIGPSFRFAGNSGDYGSGLSLEAGLLKRFNRMVSLGPYLSYSKFDYDASISNSFNDKGATGNNVFYDGGYVYWVVDMKGGDLKFLTLGLNMRIDFIPVERIKKFAVFGIVKPFILVSNRSDVSAQSVPWLSALAPDVPGHDDPINWSTSPGDDVYLSSATPGYERWGASTQFSGGINAGVGGEFKLRSGLTFSLQSTVGFIFPITYIDTSAFLPTEADGYNNPDYPFVKKTFPTLTVSLGVAYTF